MFRVAMLGFLVPSELDEKEKRSLVNSGEGEEEELRSSSFSLQPLLAVPFVPRVRKTSLFGRGGRRMDLF